MSAFSLGYAQVNINPPLGIDISGVTPFFSWLRSLL